MSGCVYLFFEERGILLTGKGEECEGMVKRGFWLEGCGFVGRRCGFFAKFLACICCWGKCIAGT